MWSPALIELIDHLDHAGTLPGPDVTVSHGSKSQGRHITLYIQLDGERVEALRYQAYGCGYTLAMAELLARAIEGADWSTLSTLNIPEMSKQLNLPSNKHSLLNFYVAALQQLANK